MSITIIDGQNEKAIVTNSNKDYNPCLPMTIGDNNEITVIFNGPIKAFEDWFPSICTQNKDYQNEYMFDGASQWNIGNLRANDYTMDSNGGYGLVRSSGDIMCTECHFANITNMLTDRPLFTTSGSFHFSETTMALITTSSSIISAKRTLFTNDTRTFVLKNSNFTNITGHNDLVELVGSEDDVEYSPFLHFELMK